MSEALLETLRETAERTATDLSIRVSRMPIDLTREGRDESLETFRHGAYQMVKLELAAFAFLAFAEKVEKR